jgi:hypothetical protein
MKVRDKRKGSHFVTHWNKPDLEVVAAVLDINDPSIYFCTKHKAYVLMVRLPEQKKVLSEWKKNLESSHTKKY